MPLYSVINRAGNHLLLNGQLNEIHDFGSSSMYGYCHGKLYFTSTNGLLGIYDLQQNKILSPPKFNSVHGDTDRTILSTDGVYYELMDEKLLRL